MGRKLLLEVGCKFEAPKFSFASFRLPVSDSFSMASVDEDEYYEMNFVPMNGLPFGVATINRESLPWQLLVADSYHSHNTDEDGDAVEVHGIKCWDSNKMVKLTLEYLPCKFECTARPKIIGHFQLITILSHYRQGIFNSIQRKKSIL